MEELYVPWGNGKLHIPVPDHWNVIQVGEPTLRPAPDDWPQRIAEAIHKPVAGAPLSQRLARLGDGKISIIVEDLTRHSPLHPILETLLSEIRHAGISDEQMEFVIACGMHPPMTEQQVREKVGPAADGIAWRCNPWDDQSQYVNVGTVGKMDVLIDRGVVESDLRIVVSSVSPHLQAGFGGGYKMFFPGCAYLDTIRMLHRFGIRREGQGQMVGTDSSCNTMRAAIDAAGSLVDRWHGETFTIQYLLDGNDLPAKVAAGDPLPTHNMVTKQCAVACGIIPEEPADVLITNSYPRDHDLWQCFKAIPNTCWAARPGGVVICLAHCPAGLNEMQTPKFWPISAGFMRRLVRLLGSNFLFNLLDRLAKTLAGDSQWFVRLGLQLLERNHLFMVSPTLVEEGAKFPGIALFYSVEDAMKAARKVLGSKPQRVAVYSAGGISYPVYCPPRPSESEQSGHVVDVEESA